MLTNVSRHAIQKVWGFRAVRTFSGSALARSDSFNKREKAAEDLYVHEHEKEKLRKLREKIEKTAKEIEQLEKELKEAKSKK